MKDILKRILSENRRYRRVDVFLKGRYLLPDGEEYTCTIVEMSAGGATLYTPVKGNPDDKIIVYIDQIGRIVGHIDRILVGGFSISFSLSELKKDRIVDKLTWIINYKKLNIEDERKSARWVPKKQVAEITLPNGSKIECRIIDMSISGAAISTSFKLHVGSKIKFGSKAAIVVRHLDNGFAVTFTNGHMTENEINYYNSHIA